MFQSGDVVPVDFGGATGVKRRPAVVLSSEIYHNYHVDYLMGELTSRIHIANTPTDYILQDWKAANLYVPTAFRVFIDTLSSQGYMVKIGRLSERAWAEVLLRVRDALTPLPPMSAVEKNI